MIDVFQRKGAKYIYELIMFLRRKKTSSLFVLKIFDFLASYFLSIILILILRLCVNNTFVKQMIDVFPRKGAKNFQLPTCSFPHFSIFEQNKFLEIFL